MIDQLVPLQHWKYPFELAERLDLDGERTGNYTLICRTEMERELCTNMIDLAKSVENLVYFTKVMKFLYSRS